ncbi:hypothetical protein MPDQ_004629 [Monascus purpureus]|uniref:2-dehydropantoate 2-reductase n=1 Tax=Monascus purpureus TaxID=5098 RepID=A0A507R6J7_MONPU|nr:hypothetical protein MPDQ_004629 [Monascus purpureus]
MAPSHLRVLSVGSNAISAFLSWRLQATASCDVTLVWKTGFESVAQSKLFGNERFKPRHVVRAPEEACSRETTYDYVILCVKALPDVYDLAAVIEPVVTPQHTCILVNTTNTLGVESQLEQRYPTNVILSIVSNVEISQIGSSEFEHLNSTEVLIGVANKEATIPTSLQKEMASAFAQTLGTGQVDCRVSPNIKQEQFERMIGPIAFHPVGVLFDTPDCSQLLQKVGVRQLISDVIDELIELASAQGCSFPEDFRQRTIDKMVAQDTPSTMYQDFQARRPMEVETFLGSPIKSAIATGVRIPRIETLYAMLHHVNIANQNRDMPPPVLAQPPPRLSSAPPSQRPPMNGAMRPGRMPPAGAMPPPGIRGPLGTPARSPGALAPPRAARDPSLEGLKEFSHLVMYDDAADGAIPHVNGNANGYSDTTPGSAAASADLALRERELALRQRELQIREQEMQMRRGGRRGPPPPRSTFDEDDEDDYFDPMDAPPMPNIDPDSVDMMSITSRRTRKIPNAIQMRRNPEMALSNSRPGSSLSRYLGGGRRRTSDRIMQEIPGLHDAIIDNPMMAYSSNRYGSVDRQQMHVESRANSLTPSRVGDFPPGPYPQSRRNSQSPGTPLGPPGRGVAGRPMPGGDPGYNPSNGPSYGQPSPPGNMRAPIPRYPSGPSNTVGPQQFEQQYGVSNPYPAKGSPNNISLTGSASASAGSGDSGASANIDSENSAHSSQISVGVQKPAMLVR